MADAKEADVEAADAKEALTEAEGAARQRRIRSGVLVGDFMHNLCDGVFIGSAFHLCGPSMGWSVTAASVYHEIAQEISDFVILTDPEQGALGSLAALALNFLSGTSVVFGVVLVLALDSFDGRATGMLLAYGGGVYIQIGAAECMAKSYARASASPKLRVLSLLAFVVGAAGIGLVLLDHEHCAAEGAGHDGHGH